MTGTTRAPAHAATASLATARPASTGRSAAARAAVALIRFYQLARTGRTSPCRFLPTCSQYAAEAIENHGFRRGLRLALRRLGRCRPGGPFGSDPVPE
jgi:putative membrane protein insertion efficiency factor